MRVVLSERTGPLRTDLTIEEWGGQGGRQATLGAQTLQVLGGPTDQSSFSSNPGPHTFA
jgi:hypothetical protein